MNCKNQKEIFLRGFWKCLQKFKLLSKKSLIQLANFFLFDFLYIITTLEICGIGMKIKSYQNNFLSKHIAKTSFKGDIIPMGAIQDNTSFNDAMLDFRFDPENSYGDSFNFAKAFHQAIFEDAEEIDKFSMEYPQQIIGQHNQCFFDSRNSSVTIYAQNLDKQLDVSIQTGNNFLDLYIAESNEHYKNLLNVIKDFCERIIIDEDKLIAKDIPLKEDFFKASAFILKKIAEIK